jgi:AcrR family transcriptional regulator
MTRIANESARSYRSPLRAEQAEETRARILDATLRVMAGGIAEVSIPAVARAAGVSVPTIYRHFGTKRDLLAALHPHLVRRAGLHDLVPARSLDELRDGIRAILNRLESLDEAGWALLASPAGEEVRHLSIPSRLADNRRFADSIKPPLSEVDRDRIARLLLVLTSSSAVRLWRDHLGLSVDGAADEIDWVIRAAVAATRRSGR